MGLHLKVNVEEANSPRQIDRAHVDRRFREHQQQKRQRHVVPENTNAQYPSLHLRPSSNLTTRAVRAYDRPNSPFGSVSFFPYSLFGSVGSSFVPFYRLYGGHSW